MMENNKELPKGELMEELLRNYFLSLGYYVARGAVLKYEDVEITDVDLFLYGRSSSLTRSRINVDIKNKKSPQAFERVLWANGLKDVLGFDACIVATTDKRPAVNAFGRSHKTVVLDGNFLAKLQKDTFPQRMSEEDLLARFSKYSNELDSASNKDWRHLYQSCKSKLLTEQDFSGFNSCSHVLPHLFEKIILNPRSREDATRLVYLVVSYLLIIVDFLSKEVAFLDSNDRENRLANGFRYGNLGKAGVDKIIEIASQVVGKGQSNLFRQSIDDLPIDILKNFFGKNDNAKHLFNWAREFENFGFNSEFTNPENLPSGLKGVIAVFLDYFKFDRRRFFFVFPAKTKSEGGLSDNVDA